MHEKSHNGTFKMLLVVCMYNIEVDITSNTALHI